MNGFEKAFETVKQLSADFRANENFFHSQDYSEQATRKDYIDKFLIALGWDVYHDSQKNPFEQEVKVERGVNVHGVQKRSDYAFYLSPNFTDVRFFVEAKKPHGDLATFDNYFQTIRYGWNAQTPLAVLTSFAEFHVLDCRARPDLKNILQANIKTYRYSDYENEEKFAEIYYLFSREAVASGSLEKFAGSLTKRGGKAGKKKPSPGAVQKIDESFLEELDDHRYALAHMFKNADSSLDGETLTEITQRTLDRLVFTRFLEDRQIETEPIVSRFGEKGSAWNDFLTASRRLDGIYNGIVFKKHDVLDSPGFKVNNAQFTGILEKLTHLHSPYDFNIIPIHILGSIYERFLGKVITAGGERARVEEKPEVRKAGGVYYTPQYIVRYIVQNTVGKMIEGKTPDQIAALRFADISCGSGSFLLEVFDTLLEYHRRYYNKAPSKARKGDCVERDGALHLSLKKRREILLNNIYGVDIDAQAVEVAQLSLYLKLLEDETIGSTHNYQLEFHETLLPSLGKNIVCGNSLIGTDILAGDLFAGGEERKLNPMDFESRFPEIMRNGGFDAIVGNPPYIRIQTLQETAPAAVAYFKRKYGSAASGNYDIYVVFIERGLKLLNECGKLGFIVPHKFFNAQYGRPLREILSNNKTLSEIVHFGDQQVFTKATTYTCLLFLDQTARNGCRVMKVDDLEKWRDDGHCVSGLVLAEKITSTEWNFTVGKNAELFEKLRSIPLKLGDVADIYVGLQTSADDVFILDYVHGKNGTITLKSKALGNEWTFEKDLFHPLVSGTDVKRYAPISSRQFILFPYEVKNENAELIDFPLLKEKYPKTAEYLTENKSRLEARERGKFRDKSWHRFGRSQNLGIQNRVKLCVPRLVEDLHGTYDIDGSHFLDNVDVGGITLKSLYRSFDLKYLLALLNSKLLQWYFPQVSAPFRGGWRSANRQFLSQLPFREVETKNEMDQNAIKKIIEWVDQIMSTKKQLSTTKTDKDKSYYESKCAALDRQIDELVYKLYGLTAEEIRIVEDSSK